ncbi:MAG: hypothetical protein ACRDB1_04565, partial [Microcoleaceae cyanobacterium]
MSNKLFLVLLKVLFKKIVLCKPNIQSEQISYWSKISTALILLTYSLPSIAQLPRFETPSPNIPVQPSPVPKPSPAPIPIPVQPPPAPIPIPVQPPPPMPVPVPIPIPVQPPPPPMPVPSPVPIPVQPSPIPAPRPVSDDISNPLPENVIPPVAVITPINGLVNVVLDNRTLTNITYEIIGDTNSRSLPGRSNVPLRNLRTPVNISFRRDDGGFLLVRVQMEPGGNTLILTLTETADFPTDRS